MTARLPRVADELIRHAVTLTLSVIGVVQLSLAPDQAGVLVWTLVIVVIVLAFASVPLWPRLPGRASAPLITAFVLASAVVFAVAPSTTVSAMVFIASARAGERLPRRGTALALAAAGSVVALATTLLMWAVDADVKQTPWWVALATWIPVYMGISRRDRAAALVSAQTAAALGERSRIAREIHDVLGHSLSGIAMQLDLADALHAGNRDDEANAAVRRARAMAVSGIAETRRAVHALRDGTLPLAETLARMAEDGSASFHAEGTDAELPVETSQAVIRAAQEALTNAHRYARGGDVAVSLRIDNDLVRLTVTDTGPVNPGHEPGPGGGMGLVGMRERAALLGGTLSAGPRPDRGWEVRLELPR